MNSDISTYGDEASGYIPDPLEGLGENYTGIDIVHVSEQNTVWRAKRFGRLWILKGLNPAHRSTASVISMRKEFEIMMSLRHPSVVEAYAIESVPDIGDCIVMEYAGDRTLGQWLATNPGRRSRQRVARRFLDALAYVHSRGVVHRDLKPSNIMVSELDEQIKIIDFGLADTISHTIFKSPAGTRGYISPEQLVMSTPDTANDIYSAGRVLSLLNAGFSWNRVASACMRSIKLRPHNVESMLRRLRLWRAFPRAGIALLLSGAAVWIMAVAAERSPALSDSSKETVITVPVSDTVASRSLDSLRTSLAQARDSLAVMMAADREREMRVKQASDKGVSMIDRRFNATAMHYLDTVSPDAPYIYTVYPLDEINAMIASYTNSLRKELSDAEVQTVYSNICIHLSEKIEQWNKRREMIISKGYVGK